MTDDVVAELDAVLEKDGEYAYSGPVGILKRARDEIVALRKLTDGNWVWKQITDTRERALEEAEIACLTEARDYVISLGQDNYRDGCRNCAAAIRALKERIDE